MNIAKFRARIEGHENWFEGTEYQNEGSISCGKSLEGYVSPREVLVVRAVVIDLRV